eukprot:CAMPEP_0118897446 /NCGR_PEP_ID=MMETSP1166-20130328/4843_1 /TAXON_ID=1104430 /ORGANISM="Chrysoreinhardia sp, Strain CCMP3193" /LENGTH=73 /DNA_ID=CAMNT_0006836517 /DNA_START=6 /DNA_END=223 /DNA_ORIENTATION=+
MKPVVVFLHGSGDSGFGAKQYVQSLLEPQEYGLFTWEFPTATKVPYSLNGGATSSVWYDRVGGLDPSFPEQTA